MKKCKGSITVFLSLILLLILAIVMTTVEAARVSVAKVYSERALTTAMDSVLAEFYLPLFQEYHIFGLDSGYGEDSIQEDTIVSKMKEYMEYTFVPNKDLYVVENYIPVRNFNLFGIRTTKAKIENIHTLLDYDGELFVGQAVSYMKYKEIGNGLESFLNKVSEIKKTDVAQTVIKEKQKTEESLYCLDVGILALMRLIDGISTTETGIKTDKQGNLLVTDYFVKKICILPVSKGNLGIENDYVYSAISSHYVQPLTLIDLALSDINSLITNLDYKNSANSKYLELQKIDQSKIKEKSKLKDLKKKIKAAKKEVEYYTQKQNDLSLSLKKRLDSINQLINQTLSAIQDAITIVDQMLIRQSVATEQIMKYKSILSSSQPFLSEDIYNSLSDDLTALERYAGNNTNSSGGTDHYDFQGMKATLLKNQRILLSIEQFTNITVTNAVLNQMKTSLTSSKSTVEQYSYDKLSFDYSTLSKPVKSDGFFESINSILGDGVMDLVMEENENISKKELTGLDLPTLLHEIDVNAEPKDVFSYFSPAHIGSNINHFSDLFSVCNEDFELMKTATDGGNAIGKMLLLQEYLLEHFNCYKESNPDASLQTLEYEKALDYELEYILMGKPADYDNLKSVIMRIVLIRTMMNFITLMGDTKSSNEARSLAIGFVGFTGLPALISIVKTLILSVWAFEESLVDVAALLTGKAVPFLKSGSALQLSIKDLFHMDKAFIMSKASGIKNNTTFTALNYQDYLRLFLFIEGKEKKSYRAMDLIQENIQNKYEDTFYIKNCLFGFRVNAEFQMDSKFIALPFVKPLLNNHKNTYRFESVQEYSY